MAEAGIYLHASRFHSSYAIGHRNAEMDLCGAERFGTHRLEEPGIQAQLVRSLWSPFESSLDDEIGRC